MIDYSSETLQPPSARGDAPLGTPVQSMRSKLFERCLSIYLNQLRGGWSRLPTALRCTRAGLMYGRHVHYLVRLFAQRGQYFATFFMRNRAELQLICQLLSHKERGSRVNIAVLACSKGAEVYSIMCAVRSARPDLQLNMYAVDISGEILDFAKKGVYSCETPVAPPVPHSTSRGTRDEVIWNTWRDQSAPIFDRITDEELRAMFDVNGNHASIKPWLRGGIHWLCADAGDPALAAVLGPQDIVVANRFLCHMEPATAESCLRNIGRLVGPGGYLFVSGVDLEVRTKVARSMNWRPVQEMMRDIHDGDVSLRQGWPSDYWGLEPFCEDRPDWTIRYAAVFQIVGSGESV